MDDTRKSSRKSRSRSPSATGLPAVLTLVARSTIVTAATQMPDPLSDWEHKRKSADVDALVLAWIAGHVQGPLYRGRLN